MTTESEIYESNANEIIAESGFYDFKLLRTTTYAMLYRARKAGKYFLVKTTKDNSERQLSMLRREYELSIGCDHSNIVHIYTFEENMSVGAGIIMEYIEGFTLSEYLAKNPTVADCNRIFEELLSCVGYLHKRGIIHNDLKPENILITRTDNTLKLIDFAVAFQTFFQKGGVFIIDEFDAALHPEIVKGIISLFNNQQYNHAGAQLIFSTHNPIYLNNKIFRRDQILFVEKDKTNYESTLYSLADFGSVDVRNDENYLINYFKGKYSSLPFIDFSKLLIDKENTNV